MSYKILITEPVVNSVIDRLNNFADVSVAEKGTYTNEHKLAEDIAGFDALLCMLSNPVTKKVLEHANRLKIIANYAVGYNNINVDEAQRRNIKVANTPDVLTEACGDFAMGLLLAVSRKFTEAETYLREGKFNGWEPVGFLGMELKERTLGIVGMGRIGQAFAKRAKAFGLNIQYHNRNRVDKKIEQELQATFVDNLYDLLNTSDIISLNCPLTSETYHLIGQKELKMMKKSALLINISRGAVVDEEALAEALHNKTIAGAGLDVFEHEPKVHPLLLTAPNCTLLPHIASATHKTRKAIGMLAADAIIAVLEGKNEKDIPNLITP